MKKFAAALAGAVFVMSAASPVFAAGKTIAVSWKIFQEERWKRDEAVIKKIVEAAGDKYISADAQGSAAKQLTDIESLISQGANVLLVVPWDSEAIMPAVQKAKDEGIPTIAYDVQIEDPSVLYMTFNNVGVGKMMAEEVMKVKDKGNFAIIKGDQGDPNSAFLLKGMMEVIKPKVDSGAIKIVGEASSDGWKPENAQKNMEQFLTKNNNKVDAVVASNDGTAGGAIAALAAQGMAGSVPVSGQDADFAALNRVALGTQTVSVWKDSRELGKEAAGIALALAGGKKMTEIKGVTAFDGGPKKVTMQSVFLKPIAITKDNLGTVIDAGWIKKETACQGVKAGSVKACN